VRVFISYARENSRQAAALAADLVESGCEAWFDRQLTGGQAWWDEILRRIRECDAFVVALSPEALASQACDREWRYAMELRRNTLPVLISGDVRSDELPPQLAEIEYIDYRNLDKAGALRLMKALNAMPGSRPLPEPLPAPPSVPMSYLGSLREQVLTATSLGFAEQSAVLVRLRQGLRDKKLADEVGQLLRQFRARDDLFARIGDEVDELLRQHAPSPTRVSTSTPTMAPKDLIPAPPAEPARSGPAQTSAPVAVAHSTAPGPTQATHGGGHLAPRSADVPDPAPAPRAGTFRAAWQSALTWAGAVFLVQLAGVLLHDRMSVLYSLWFVAGAYAIAGALSYPIVLRGLGLSPMPADYLRGGASWLAAPIACSAIGGLFFDIQLHATEAGTFLSALMALVRGSVFGAVGAGLMLVAMRFSSTGAPRGNRRGALITWTVAFGVALATQSLISDRDWPPLMAVRYPEDLVSWISGALLRPLAWTAGLWVLLGAGAGVPRAAPGAGLHGAE
jgi:hypothetical protein